MPQDQQQPGGQPSFNQQQQNMTQSNPQQQGTFSNPAGGFGNQPGAFSNQPGAFNNQPGAFGNQPGAFSNQTGGFGNQSSTFGGQQQQQAFGGVGGRLQHKGPQVVPTMGNSMTMGHQQTTQQQQQQQQNVGAPNLMQKLNEITAPGGDILSKGKELIFMKFGLGGK